MYTVSFLKLSDSILPLRYVVECKGLGRLDWMKEGEKHMYS